MKRLEALTVLDVFLYLSLPYFSETGLLTEPPRSASFQEPSRFTCPQF